jgi:hypothetical protein
MMTVVRGSTNRGSRRFSRNKAIRFAASQAGAQL